MLTFAGAPFSSSPPPPGAPGARLRSIAGHAVTLYLLLLSRCLSRQVSSWSMDSLSRSAMAPKASAQSSKPSLRRRPTCFVVALKDGEKALGVARTLTSHAVRAPRLRLVRYSPRSESPQPSLLVPERRRFCWRHYCCQQRHRYRVVPQARPCGAAYRRCGFSNASAC
jgi:hypothetical protein